MRTTANLDGNKPFTHKYISLTGKTMHGYMLIRQLEHWSSKYPKGFFKFLAPCGNTSYKEGMSWTEELLVSKDVFRRLFDRIGVRHKSFSRFADARNFGREFRRPDGSEALYCSYHNHLSGRTYYLRNHKLADGVMAQLTNSMRPRAARSTPINHQQVHRPTKPTWSAEPNSHNRSLYSKEKKERQTRQTTQWNNDFHPHASTTDARKIAVCTFCTAYKEIPGLPPCRFHGSTAPTTNPLDLLRRPEGTLRI